MTWLLILTFALPGQPESMMPTGIMVTEEACHIAGAGMVAILEDANPGLSVTWTCMKQGAEA